jgi:hypothetical protein
MSSTTYTGTYPGIYNTTTVAGGGQAGMIAAGTTRWNQTISQMEMWDGYQWQAITQGELHTVTLAEEVEHAEDRIAGMIEEDYPDNATILDAFKSWQAANERFRVVLAIAEKK